MDPRKNLDAPVRLFEDTTASRRKITAENWRRLAGYHRSAVLILIDLLLAITLTDRLLRLRTVMIAMIGVVCSFFLYTIFPANPLAIPVALGGGACAATLLYALKLQTA